MCSFILAAISCLISSQILLAQPAPKIGEMLLSLDNTNYVTLHGDIAYVSTGQTGLAVLDLSQNDSSHWIDHFPMENYDAYAGYSEIAGERLYLACGSDGVRIFDVTTPNAPEETFRLEVPRGATRLTIHENLLYVASASRWLNIYSLDDPDRPVQLGAIEGPFNSYIHDIDVKDGVAYLCCNTSLQGGAGILSIWVDDPENPAILETIRTGGNAFRLDISNEGYGYLVERNQGLRILDLRDMLQPDILDLYPVEGNSGFISVVEDLVYLGFDDGIIVYEMIDPVVLEVAGSNNQISHVYSVAVDRNRIVTAGRSFNILQWAEQNELNVTGSFNPPDRHVIGITDRRAYLHHDKTVEVWDLTNSPDLEKIGEWQHSSSYDDYTAHSNLLLARTDDYQSFSIIDFRDPRNPDSLTTVRRGEDDYIYMICADGSYLYTSWSDGLHIYDIEDPGNPRVAGRLLTQNFLGWITGVSNGKLSAYHVEDVSVIPHEVLTEYSWHLIDVSNVASPRLIRREARINDRFLALGIYNDAAYVSVAGPAETNRFHIYSIASNPPEFVDELEQFAAYDIVQIIDDRLFLLGREILVLDLTNPLAPQQIGSIDASNSKYLEGVSRGKAYLTDRYRLHIYNCSDFLAVEPDELVEFTPSSLSLSCFPSPFNSSTTISFSLPPGFGEAGLRVYDLSGRLVADLTPKAQSLKPKAQVVWNAKDMPAGVYIVRLEGEGKAVSRKIVLIR